MVNKVVFFNLYHNGDIHISRGLVHKIAKVCEERGITCEYFHNNDPGLLADIPNLIHTKQSYGISDPGTQSYINKNIAFINTWYCGTNNMYNTYGLTFECLYYSFVENAKIIDIDITKFDVHELFPRIDYSAFHISHAYEWMSNDTGKKVFISNGLVRSGQATNFPFAGIVNTLSNERSDVKFIVSEEDVDIIKRPNVFFTRDIIQKNGFDLNENAFIADNCDLIVGRMSGAFSFAMNHVNYFENKKKFIAITNLEHRYVSWVDIIKPTATFDVFNYNIPDPVTNVIRERLP